MKTLSGFSIGSLRIDPPLLLAPMAGVSHVALRELVARFGGCGLFVSEMLSSRAIAHEKKEDAIFLKKLAHERPFFYQLMGNDPERMAGALRNLEAYWEGKEAARADGFDINMGCGAPWLRRNGCGAGLLQNTDLARRIVKACRKATALPLTVKMRLVSAEDEHKTLDHARMLQDEGVDAVTLHARLGNEKFRRTARWEYVLRLKRILSIPVIGNGDIRCPGDVHRRLDETGCDGIMIGRQAVMHPWIFRVAAGGESLCVDLHELYQSFVSLLVEHFPLERRLGRLKEYTHYFSGNFRFGHHLALAVQNAPSFDEALLGAEEFIANHREECLVTI